MKKLIAPFFFLLFIIHYSQSQSDSTYFDLGRLKQQREFTQTITLKGSDFDKLPFANLSDAIDVWLYGGITDRRSLIYVIDGILISDVDGYHITDIEEITLVQNALTHINGAIQGQYMVLIKTKKVVEEGVHFTGGAQLDIVSNKTEAAPFDTIETSIEKGLYHQYYLTSHIKKKGFNSRVTADYLRDISPSNYYNITPFNMDRFRLNAYAEKYLTKGTSLELYLNYVPQVTNSASNLNRWNEEDIFSSRQKLLTTGITLKNHTSNGFSHQASFNYSSSRRKRGIESNIYDLDAENEKLVLKSNDNTNYFLFKDDFFWKKTAGNFGIRPSVNFTFRYGKLFDKKEHSIDYPNTPFSSTSSSKFFRSFTITPSVDVNYRNAFNVQIGFLTNLRSESDVELLNPFFAASTDIIRWINKDSDSELKLFASYAKATHFYDYANQLSDLNTAIPFFTEEPLPDPNNTPNTSSNVFNAGGFLSLMNERLTLNYSYNKRNGPILVSQDHYQPFTPNPYNTYFDATLEFHRAAINSNILKSATFKWYTGLSYSRVKTIYDKYITWKNSSTFKDNSWYGGWVNRIQLKSLNLGLDVIYQLKEEKYNIDYNYPRYSVRNYDNVSLQNFFIGYNFINNNAKVEIYLNSRNLIFSKDVSYSDKRRYYGVGIKINM